MAKIKICGLTRKQDIDAVNAALPDYIGFVFANSKRQVDMDLAIKLKSRLNPLVKAVGVFVNEDIGNVIGLCKEGIVDVIQLHGDEDENYIKCLKNNVQCKIIKAVRVKGREDILKAMEFPCDYLLFDTYHKEKYGGVGQTFDWSLISGVNRPFFLAGGINLYNIKTAVNMCNPYCVDVSGGVETDGLKDPQKINDIVSIIRKITKER